MWARIRLFVKPWDWDAAVCLAQGLQAEAVPVGIGQGHASMTNSKGYDSPCHVLSALKGVQDRRRQSNVEPGGPCGRRSGHPRYRHAREGRRPAEGIASAAPWPPEVGIDPSSSDAELVTLAGIQALLRAHLRCPMAPHVRALTCAGTCLSPSRPASPARTLQALARRRIAAPALDRPRPGRRHHRVDRGRSVDTTVSTKDVQLADSTLVESASSEETAKGSDLDRMGCFVALSACM